MLRWCDVAMLTNRWSARLADRRVLWLALGVAAGLRGCAWWWAAAPQQDELSYQATARWLVEHGEQRLFWPPVTSWLIAAVFAVLGPSFAAARVLWIGLDLVNLGLLWQLAGTVSAGDTPAPAASGTSPVPGLVVLGHAVSLPAISYAVHTTSETPAVALLLAMLLLLRPEQIPAAPAPAPAPRFGTRAALAGLCGGALVLTRTSLGLVPLALAALLVREGAPAARQRDGWGSAGLLLGLTALLVSGYVLRNRVVTGQAVLAQNTTYNFHRGNGPTYQEDLNLFWPVATPQQIELRVHQRDEAPVAATPAQLRHEAWAYIQAHPGIFARRALGRLARLTVPRTEQLTLLGGEERIRIEDGRSIALLLLGVLQWAPLLLLGTAGLLALQLHGQAATRAWANRFLVVVAAGIAPALIAISKPRFGYVFEPLLLIAAAAFVANLRTWRPQLRHPVTIALYAFYAWAQVAWLIFAVTSRTGS